MKKFPYLTFFGTWLMVFCAIFGAPFFLFLLSSSRSGEGRDV